jgi:Amidohydrolase
MGGIPSGRRNTGIETFRREGPVFAGLLRLKFLQSS